MGAELSLPKQKLPVNPNFPKCNIIGFNGKGNSTAKKFSNVTFEIPGLMKADTDIWFCHGLENILGIDLISKLNWIIDLGNYIFQKDPPSSKSVYFDHSMYTNVGSMCTITDKSLAHNWPDIDDNFELEQLLRSHKNLWSQNKKQAVLFKDIEVDTEGRVPKLKDQYGLLL